MSRQPRTTTVFLLLLLVFLIGLTLHQVHQAHLNQDLITALHDYWNVQATKDRTRYSLKALAALKAGADPNSWADIDRSGKIQRPSWRERLSLSPWPFLGQKRKNYIRRSALELAVRDREVQLVKTLLDRGAIVHAREKSAPQDISPLGYAALCGDEEIVTLLLDHGADVNERQTGSPGTTLTSYVPFIRPVYTGSTPFPKESYRRLIKGIIAEKSSTPFHSYTPLMLVVSITNNPTLECLLIRRGANVNIRTKDGKTALGFALDQDAFWDEYRRSRMIQILKVAGAKE